MEFQQVQAVLFPSLFKSMQTQVPKQVGNTVIVAILASDKSTGTSLNPFKLSSLVNSPWVQGRIKVKRGPRLSVHMGPPYGGGEMVWEGDDNQLRGLGESYELPQWGPASGAIPGSQRFSCI